MLTHSRFPSILLGVMALGVIGLWAALADDSAQALSKAELAQFDQGPRTIDVSGYPDKIQDYYEIFSKKCSQCHKLSRPINCNFVLPSEWSRYIKRMMHKPGSGISGSQAKKIYEFLVYDTSIRKRAMLDKRLAKLSSKDKAEAEAKIKKVRDEFDKN